MARSLGTVLLTGGAGFIRSHLLHHPLAADPAVPIASLGPPAYAGARGQLDRLPGPLPHPPAPGAIR